MSTRPRPPRGPTPEELELWRLVTRADKPLAGKKKRARGETPASSAKTEITSKPESAARNYKNAAGCLSAPTKPAGLGSRKAKPVKGDMAALDAQNARRFKRGKMEIDGRLDLHGLTSEKARKQVHAFLHKHIARGSRCLLIITGKGLRRADAVEPERPGILQGLLPSWLAHDDIAPMILAFDHAPPLLGGRGAWLILLKRKR